MNKVTEYFCIFCDFTNSDFVHAFKHYKSHMTVKDDSDECDDNTASIDVSDQKQSDEECDHSETELTEDDGWHDNVIEEYDKWIDNFLKYQNKLFGKTYSSIVLSNKVCVECVVCRSLVKNYKKNGGDIKLIQYDSDSNVEHCYKHLRYSSDSHQIQSLDVFIEEECCDTFFIDDDINNDNSLSNEEACKSTIEEECVSTSESDDSSSQISPQTSQPVVSIVVESEIMDTTNDRSAHTTDSEVSNVMPYLDPQITANIDNNTPNTASTGAEQQDAAMVTTSPPLPSSSALVERCVIIEKDERGYGLHLSGDNPVLVESVRPDGAAWRAGVRAEDRIIKVNGTDVTKRRHRDVVTMIQNCGTYAGLTLLGLKTSATASVTAAAPLLPTTVPLKALKHYKSEIQMEMEEIEKLMRDMEASHEKKTHHRHNSMSADNIATVANRESSLKANVTKEYAGKSIIIEECDSTSESDDSSSQISPQTSQPTVSSVVESSIANTNDQSSQTTDSEAVDVISYLDSLVCDNGSFKRKLGVIYGVLLKCALVLVLFYCLTVDQQLTKDGQQTNYTMNVEKELQTCLNGVNNITNKLNTTMINLEITESKVNALSDVIRVMKKINEMKTTANNTTNISNETLFWIYVYIIVVTHFIVILAFKLYSSLQNLHTFGVDSSKRKVNASIDKDSSDFAKQLVIKDKEIDRLNTKIFEFERSVTVRLNLFDHFVVNTNLKFEKTQTELNTANTETVNSICDLKKASDETITELKSTKAELNNILPSFMQHKHSIHNQIADYYNTSRKEITAIKNELSNAVTHPGTIAYFAIHKAPDGWLIANGQSVSRNRYKMLFHTIGIQFGYGNGFSTFNLPDLRPLDTNQLTKNSEKAGLNILRQILNSNEMDSTEPDISQSDTKKSMPSQNIALLACIKY